MKSIASVILLTLVGCSSSNGNSAGSVSNADAGGDSTRETQEDATSPTDATSTIDAISAVDAAHVDCSDGLEGSVGSNDASPHGDAGLSYMVGIKTNGIPTGPAKVEGWLGRPLDVAGTTIATTGYIGNDKPYTTVAGTYPLLEVSFPLLTNGTEFGPANTLDDLQAAATGSYDAAYTKMAENLASWKNPLLSVRISWEFNGNWYAWSNGVGTHATYANYIAAFKRAAAIIKSKNPHALIQWCIAWGQADPTPYWPGAYDATTNPGGVDVVSMDFYQANISKYNTGGTTSTWAVAQSGNNTTGKIVLDWMTTFAQAQHVKMALSEYGAGGPNSKGSGSGTDGGLDDGTWTREAIAWMNGLPAGLFLWANWSDDAPADDIVTAGANPMEQAAWVNAWGGTHFAGTWWMGQAPP